MMHVDVLECTLRDGSYRVDFQFTAKDTALIASALEQVGFKWIEIGHGLGLNASDLGKGIAAASDRDYLKAASMALTKARFGMFCIPGIATLDHVKMCADYGMSLIRIGTDVTEVSRASEYISLAHELGMVVSVNLMKSYALSIERFLKQAQLAESFGADVICVVDSAGGMMSEDVDAYVSILNNETNVDIGFHGHNNLQLAVANSLTAIKAGAKIIDTTLQGLGRSSGNTPTEILVPLLEKLEYQTGIDAKKTMDIGEILIRPLMASSQGVDIIEVCTGLNQFHSSFLNIAMKQARTYKIDIRDLIEEVSRVDKVNIDENLVENIADRLALGENSEKSDTLVHPVLVKGVRQEENSKTIGQDIDTVLSDIISRSGKSNKGTVFAIAKSRSNHPQHQVYPYVRENDISVIGNCEFSDIESALKIVKRIDGVVETIFVDIDQPSQDLNRIRDAVDRSQLLYYSDSEVLLSASEMFLKCHLQDLSYLKAVLSGNHHGVVELGRRIARYRGQVVIQKDGMINQITWSEKDGNYAFTEIDEDEFSHSCERCNVFIAMYPFTHTVGRDFVEKLSHDVLLLDIGIGSFSEDAIKYAHDSKMEIYRIDMRTALSEELAKQIKTHNFIKNNVGRRKINGVDVVAGGVLGKGGDVIVDSITNPKTVIGVADGTGGVLGNEHSYTESVEKVNAALFQEQFSHILLRRTKEQG